jgi:hypothetical protein
MSNCDFQPQESEGPTTDATHALIRIVDRLPGPDRRLPDLGIRSYSVEGPLVPKAEPRGEPDPAAAQVRTLHAKVRPVGLAR